MEALREASSIEAFGTVVAIVGGCCALQRHDRSKMESMVKEFLKEFLASCCLFVIFYIGCTYIAVSSLPSSLNWVYHAACVLALDWMSGGACMNPAVSTGLWVNGTFDTIQLILHLTAQVFAGQYGFYLLKAVTSVVSEGLFDSIQGPNYSGLVNGKAIPLLNMSLSGLIHNDMITAFIVELICMFILCFVIYYIEGRVQSALTKVAIVALTLRFNMFFTEDLTGANMNPMVAYSWLFHLSEGTNSILGAYYQKEYIMVYLVAPVIGGAIAALLVTALPKPGAVASSAPKNKADASGGSKKKEEEQEEVPAKKSGGSSRGRSRARKAEPEPEPEVEVEEQKEEEEEEEEPKPAPKKASRSRSKSQSKSKASKAKSSPSPAPAPKRRTSSRRR